MIVITIVILLVAAIAAQRDPSTNVCRRHKQLTCVIDSKLYVYGGVMYYGDGWSNSSVLEDNTYFMWEDLTQVSTTGTRFPDLNSTLPISADVPLVVGGGALWADDVNKMIYLFGGDYKSTEDLRAKNSQGGFSFWAYDVIYSKWEEPKADGSQATVRWPSLGASAVSDAGIAYYYGGCLTNTSDSSTSGAPVMQSGLISYNMHSANNRRWKIDAGNQIARAEGSLQYLPASDVGLLIYLGGVEEDSSGLVNFSIHVYNIASSRWYTQEAGGDIPQARRGFCTGAVWAKDFSSYNIYIFGGFDAGGAALGDTFVLSMPSFVWIPIYPTPTQKTFRGGKGWSSCNVFLESQMMIMGGYYTNVSKTNCDEPSIANQHNMLLGQENVERNVSANGWWHAPVDNITGYRVPDQIIERIGGEADGKATATMPLNSWATRDLEVFFSTTYTGERSATRSIPTMSTSTAIPPPPPRKTNVPAIAGGTVGGVLSLAAVIVGVVLYLHKRKKRAAQAHEQVESQLPEVAMSSETQDLDSNRKPPTTASMTQVSTLHSHTPNSLPYSIHDSPPPQFNTWQADRHHPASYYQTSPSPEYHGSPSPQHQSGDWGYQAEYAQVDSISQGRHTYHQNQTYYPPPPAPSTSPHKESFAHIADIQEMPNVRSPVNLR